MRFKKEQKKKIESQKVRKIGRMQFQLFSPLFMMLGFMSAFMFFCFLFFFFFFFPGFNFKLSVVVINEAYNIVVVTNKTLIKVFRIGPITRPRSIVLARVRIPRAKTADWEPVRNFFINDNLIILTTPHPSSPPPAPPHPYTHTHTYTHSYTHNMREGAWFRQYLIFRNLNDTTNGQRTTCTTCFCIKIPISIT